jgi:enterobactin synthetase component D
MLTTLSFESAYEDASFIKYIEIGHVEHLPNLTYCIAEYNADFYSDYLFDTLGLVFPSFLRNAAIKRKAEYFAGRYCARMLIKDKFIYSVSDAYPRVPVWPDGWCGSISHTDRYAMVVTASQASGISVGVDIENKNLESALEAQQVFAAPEERAFLLNTKLPYALGLLILFSAKESLYKLLWSKVKRNMGFTSAKIVGLDEEKQGFTLALTESLTSALGAGVKFDGKYAFYKGVIITCIANTALM